MANFISSHMALLPVLFVVLSNILNQVAIGFVSMGEKVPGFLGDAASFFGKLAHLFNGNLAAAKPADPSLINVAPPVA